jgi:hypothetical protein
MAVGWPFVVGRSPLSFERYYLDLIITRQPRVWYGKMGIMPKKRKRKKFGAVETVKAMARERIGSPKASRIVLGRKKKQEKHKPTMQTLLKESD